MDRSRTRKEHDRFGELELPAQALWGIHAERARLNFPPSWRRLPRPLIAGMGYVKQACATANHELGHLADAVHEALTTSCDELVAGVLDEHLVVDPLAGGAGTSFNMNVNEVLANRANVHLGGAPGDYEPVDPLDTVNMHQSTNDTFSTAVRVAALTELVELEQELVGLQDALQDLEKRHADEIAVGRTQLQDAVPLTLGQVFGAWAEAIARDRWRVFKSMERLRAVNLGGTAIGTGLGAPREYIFAVVGRLRELTGLPVSRAENLVEATGNQDALVEADGVLTAPAANLAKLSWDLRILSMPAVGELSLPAVQAGSSIMPGKINPVVAEYAWQCAQAVIGGHAVLTQAVAAGNLQLSQFLPLAAWHLLDNLRLLRNAVVSTERRCVRGINVNVERARMHLEQSLSVAAALVPALGYETVQGAVLLVKEEGLELREALKRAGASEEDLNTALSPTQMRRLGD